ncbi:TetR/AcrR family transcriptional regulator [Prauserella oleivorans]|uniref:TetR/AcrR family transcriptional regulator n=1 Tax=Prauserella oleivorans TaxID=1478153 RepID=A0ABW5WB12_9PSEU
MAETTSTPSARKAELLERAYRYALEHGLADLSLRPLASAIGSSPRVLLFLFGSKDGLIREILARARADELALLERVAVEAGGRPAGLAVVAERLWGWLAADEHRALLKLWVEGYARSLVDPDGSWAGFAEATVRDWLSLLADSQPPSERTSRVGLARRTYVLAVLRGALLDLLATGDRDRTTAAVRTHLESLRA